MLVILRKIRKKAQGYRAFEMATLYCMAPGRVSKACRTHGGGVRGGGVG